MDIYDAFAAAFSAPDAAQPGALLVGGKLAHAVRGFFRNGGRACWIARVAGEPGSSAFVSLVAEGLPAREIGEELHYSGRR
jgi:hypothetical protein